MPQTIIQPLGKRVFLRKIYKKNTSGIIIPDKAPEGTNTAEVMLIGNEVSNVSVGDVVVYLFGFEELTIDDNTYLIGNCDNIIAIKKVIE